MDVSILPILRKPWFNVKAFYFPNLRKILETHQLTLLAPTDYLNPCCVAPCLLGRLETVLFFGRLETVLFFLGVVLVKTIELGKEAFNQ